VNSPTRYPVNGSGEQKSTDGPARQSGHDRDHDRADDQRRGERSHDAAPETGAGVDVESGLRYRRYHGLRTEVDEVPEDLQPGRPALLGVELGAEDGSRLVGDHAREVLAVLRGREDRLV